MSATLEERVKAQAARLGFDLLGIAPLGPSEHAAFYREWLAAGRHGTMAYLERPDAVQRRLEPNTVFPELRSAVVLGLNYAPSAGPEATPPERGVIARYARGRDYHKVLKKKLLALLEWLERETGRALPAARACVDTAPVLERELARRAGLGWFGRNTMLINPRRGSYFFLGALLLELELEPDEAFAQDHCGTCNACVDACPTGALLGRDASGAPVMDATRCISYLTIENRGAIPRELRPLIGNRVFGCDICQEVCPWNGPKFVQVTGEPGFLPHGPGSAALGSGSAAAPLGSGWGGPSLIELMRMTPEKWDVWTRGSAIRRAGYAGFKRNVAVAIGNWLASVGEPPADALAVLRDAIEHDGPLVEEHAAWALKQVR